MHEHALMKAELEELRRSNKMLNKRRRARKTRLQQRISHYLAEAQVLQDQKDLDGQIREESRAEGARGMKAERQQ